MRYVLRNCGWRSRKRQISAIAVGLSSMDRPEKQFVCSIAQSTGCAGTIDPNLIGKILRMTAAIRCDGCHGRLYAEGDDCKAGQETSMEGSLWFLNTQSSD